MRNKTIQRFWAKVDKSAGPDECWPWTAGTYKGGYGQFFCEGEGRRAQAVAKELATGELAAGRCACHTCDNPPCCNPSHIFWDTSQGNTADRHKKHRSARGERAGLAILTDAQVVEIRTRYTPHDPIHGRKPLAEEFGVSQVTIADLLRGKTWTHCLDVAPCQPKKPYYGKPKLSAAQVTEIRERYPAETQIILAEEFGVHQATISAIVRGVTHKSEVG